MQYGLTSNTIERINQVFAKFLAIEKVVIYGSRAKGNYKNGSDIDLCIFGNIDLNLLYDIEEALDDLLLPYTIDLIVYSKLKNQDLKDHIDRVGMLFYSS